MLLLCSIPLICAADTEHNNPNLESILNYHPQLQQGVFLVASQEMADPNFRKTVILVTRYDSEGSAGLVINRAMQLHAGDAFPQITELTDDVGNVQVGGPVMRNNMQLLVQITDPPGQASPLFGNIYLVSNKRFFEQLTQNKQGNKAARLYMGYTGWAAGQLEAELIRGDWYIWHPTTQYIFSEPQDKVWHDLFIAAGSRWVYNQTWNISK